MLTLKSLFAASAALTLIAGVNAGALVQRNQEPAEPSCTQFTPYVYSGCFHDPIISKSLLYKWDAADTSNMTVAQCTAFCKGNDYRYAGLEYYGQCFCGASVVGYAIDESNCNFPCSGNSSEACGAGDIMSIYSDPTFPTVSLSLINDYKYMGCYSDLALAGRTLNWRQDQLPEPTMTVEGCLAACKAGGYGFAGVEYSQECYCSVVMGNGTLLLDESQCNMPCTGDSSEMCGGSRTLNLYVALDLESSEPCTGGSAPPSASSSTVSSSYPSSTPIYSTTSTSTTSTDTYSTTSTSSSTTSTSSSTTSTSSSTTSTSSSTTSTSSTTSSTTSTSSPTTYPTTSPTSSKPVTTPTTYPTTSTTSTTSSKPVTTPPTTTIATSTTASLCTTTVTISPTPTCEYQCGGWCSAPMPDFSDKTSCSTAAEWVAVQVASCFVQAGWPASLQCFDFAGWASSIKTYCSSACPGGNCSKGSCKKQYPPSGPAAPSSTVTTSVYTCAPAKPTTTSFTTTTSATTSVPVPTNSNICTQPSNSRYGYSGSSPVGNVPMPCLTCNNLKSDFNAGNVFKLYTHPDTTKCGSYKKPSCASACQDSCDAQYASCKTTYANSCSSNSFWAIWFGGADSYSSATTKCTQQWNDCYSANKYTTGASRCGSWNAGWS
ncbi:hypothetical protein BP6252_07839 [Coleophoma cylindrospora]|uniref:WSC domain-containing protein n=1 Tax=Coleophoma cylindrospora TaxID=1849047 RepID=A0A3D8RBC8_9HELO|nr:hypothetical protein BP6252_07839 [Coleophoma cylindrospora]